MAAPISYLTGIFKDAGGSLRANASIAFSRLGTPAPVDTDIIVSNALFTALDANGALGDPTPYPLVTGYYRVTLSDRDGFDVYVPDDGGTYDISTLVTQNTAGSFTQVVLDGSKVFGVIDDTVSVKASKSSDLKASRSRVLLLTGSNATDTPAMASLVSALDPSDIFALGDLFFSGSPADGTRASDIYPHYWPWIIENTGLGTHPTFNHFWYVPGQTDVRAYVASGFYQPSGDVLYYKRTINGVDFFVIDSTLIGGTDGNAAGTTSGSTQGQWLQAQLAASTASLKIVVMAELPTGSVSGYSVPNTNWPFAAWGAHAVIGGGPKIYERQTIDGIPYISIGTTNHTALSTIGTPLSTSQYRYASEHGFACVDVNDGSALFSYVTASGIVCDEFLLQAPASHVRFNVEVQQLGGLKHTDEGLAVQVAAVREAEYIDDQSQRVVRLASVPTVNETLARPWWKEGLLLVGDDPASIYYWNRKMNAWDLLVAGGISQQYASSKPQLAVPTIDKDTLSAAGAVIVYHATATEIYYSLNGADFVQLAGWPTYQQIDIGRSGVTRLFLYARKPLTNVDSQVVAYTLIPHTL